MLQILRAENRHIGRIRELETEAFGFTWEVDVFEKELTRDNGFTAVLLSQSKVIGAALVVWAETEAQLNSIVLDPEVRGKGYSRFFLGGLMRWLRDNGFHWITLEVKWSNSVALALYRRFGFVTTACRPKYYSDGQDARIMWAGHLQTDFFSELLREYEPPGTILGSNQ